MTCSIWGTRSKLLLLFVVINFNKPVGDGKAYKCQAKAQRIGFFFEFCIVCPNLTDISINHSTPESSFMFKCVPYHFQSSSKLNYHHKSVFLIPITVSTMVHLVKQDYVRTRPNLTKHLPHILGRGAKLFVGIRPNLHSRFWLLTFLIWSQ